MHKETYVDSVITRDLEKSLSRLFPGVLGYGVGDSKTGSTTLHNAGDLFLDIDARFTYLIVLEFPECFFVKLWFVVFLRTGDSLLLDTLWNDTSLSSSHRLFCF